jgi:8-oxo-dGTP pyrophosphatase MutT (NUDIX family)
MSTPAPEPKVLTLCFLRDGNRLLLGMKKRGYGAGRWNGFGGKVEAGETIEEAARRELLEEAGVRASALERRGILYFQTDDDPVRLAVHVFLAARWDGEPAETEEMRPEWHRTDSLPFDDMWPDDRHWMPSFLAGHYFCGTFFFRDERTIRYWHLEASGAWSTAIGVPAWKRDIVTGLFTRRIVG